jgi:tetratricopeptide (TPR) repeat protein
VAEKTSTRRQLIEDARKAALSSDWEGAIRLNQEIIERSPRDAEAYNRLGRALLEFRRSTAAHEAYSNALKIDPANMIARRNLHRLELIRHRRGEDTADSARATVMPRSSTFIEEVGKTWVDELVNPAPLDELADIYSGEQLQFNVVDGRLMVLRANGQSIGEVEAKTAERIIELMAGGNRYDVFALGLSAESLRVILRESYRDPSQVGRVSFPRQITATRAYMRERDDLRRRDEAEFLLLDEDEEEIEDEEPGLDTVDEEDGADPDTDSFIEDVVAESEDEPQI